MVHLIDGDRHFAFAVAGEHFSQGRFLSLGEDRLAQNVRVPSVTHVTPLAAPIGTILVPVNSTQPTTTLDYRRSKDPSAAGSIRDGPVLFVALLLCCSINRYFSDTRLV